MSSAEPEDLRSAPGTTQGKGGEAPSNLWRHAAGAHACTQTVTSRGMLHTDSKQCNFKRLTERDSLVTNSCIKMSYYLHFYFCVATKVLGLSGEALVFDLVGTC